MATIKTAPAKTIDEYIARFPKDTRVKLNQLRETIKKAVPQASEAISYKIPAFKLNGNRVFFAAFKNHIGFYPAPREVEEFKKQLTAYEGAKGTVRFPLNEPLPIGLINRMVKYMVKKQLEKEKLKGKKTKDNCKIFREGMI